MSEISSIVGIIVGLLAVITHLANMADRQRKEGAREERVNQLINKMDEVLSRIRALEEKVILLEKHIARQDEELQYLRKQLRNEI